MRLPYTCSPLHNVEYDYVAAHFAEIHRIDPFPLEKRIVGVFIKRTAIDCKNEYNERDAIIRGVRVVRAVDCHPRRSVAMIKHFVSSGIVSNPYKQWIGLARVRNFHEF